VGGVVGGTVGVAGGTVGVIGVAVGRLTAVALGSFSVGTGGWLVADGSGGRLGVGGVEMQETSRRINSRKAANLSGFMLRIIHLFYWNE
jgi:hypothetical protein